MNQQYDTETEFERRLGAELTTIVVEREAEQAAWRASGATPSRPAWRRRGPRLALAGTAVAAIAAAALIVNAGGGDTPAAFAVEPRPEGMVSVEIRVPEEAAGLEAALEEVGIPASVTYLDAGMTCEEPRFQTAPWPEGAFPIVVGSPRTAPRELENATILGTPEGGRAVIVEPANGGGPRVFSVNRAAVGPGQTLVITASAGTEGFLNGRGPTRVELAEGTVAPCEPIPAASDNHGR